MQQLPLSQVAIHDRFWAPRQHMNAEKALTHQWEQLERSGCIDNFRLAAGEMEGLRQGWFFADSDAYKWLDAACRVYATRPSSSLQARIDTFIDLIGRAQTSDGYLYTYNQIHFPGQRWLNLQIEHELYCHGHLIEAAASHYAATGQRKLLTIAEKAADLLVDRFLNAGPEDTPGHEEIELALIRLYRVAGKGAYLDLAEQLLERRGRAKPFARLIWQQNRSVGQRSREVQRQRAAHSVQHPEYTPPALPGGNRSRKPRGMRARFFLSTLTGKYFQQHRPVQSQTVPVGHAVRFSYLQTAVAMLCREKGDRKLLPALEAAWDRMVRRRMYVTGGIGSLPEIEGFGRDYELDPYFAYAETCAALGCIFWNWEMFLITRDARYVDLFEWQLYNAASVGLGVDGTSYLYNNPLATQGGIMRRPWFQVPCCPSNLSRTWASLGQYVFSHQEAGLWIHQYVGCRTKVDLGQPVELEMESGLPWNGHITLRLQPARPAEFTIHLRLPEWSDRVGVAVNGPPPEPAQAGSPNLDREAEPRIESASGLCPDRARYLPITRTWSPGDRLELKLSMPIVARYPHRRVRSLRGRVALTRGPLVYCLESVDNPGLDLFNSVVDLATLESLPGHLLGQEMVLLQGRTTEDQPFVAIPYFSWANRGESQMAVMVRCS